METCDLLSVRRISFEKTGDLDLVQGLNDPDPLYCRLRDDVLSGPFCRDCLDQEGRLYLLAHSSDPAVHLKCPNCALA